jgi:hypothetical protein
MTTTVKIVYDSFTRPADGNAYTSGDLVANSTTAASVVPMTFAFQDWARGGLIRRCRIRKSGTSVTSASFRLHLYTSKAITCANGDNGAWSTNLASNYVGAFDITVDKAFTDGASGNGIPIMGSEINFQRNTYYGLLEARDAYTPSSAETFLVELEVMYD